MKKYVQQEQDACREELWETVGVSTQRDGRGYVLITKKEHLNMTLRHCSSHRVHICVWNGNFVGEVIVGEIVFK